MRFTPTTVDDDVRLLLNLARPPATPTARFLYEVGIRAYLSGVLLANLADHFRSAHTFHGFLAAQAIAAHLIQKESI